ncbi:MAG: hypothetical protein A2063_09285 [Gallionellales bacterium GWA2_60_142]|nr:MAG: hypothetical protein A2063_09285 [Gallionellales bacterium GWA2_60_142]HCI13474.1 hypothetical protein [Gallionellaceae bacterium]
MKNKPAKLLMALMLSIGSIAFVSTAAYAEDDKSKDTETKDSKDSKDSKDTEAKDSKDTDCTTTHTDACSLSIYKTTCTDAATIADIKSKAEKSEEQDDGTHKSKDKDTKGKNDRDYVEDSHKDHANRSGSSEGGKVAICHRMGGAEVSLVVANDGYLNGHSKHALDTVGRCGDFDDDDRSKSSKDKDTDTKVSASDSCRITQSIVSCLKGDEGSTHTINGKSYTSPGGLNASGVKITCGNKTSRGGARIVR